MPRLWRQGHPKGAQGICGALPPRGGQLTTAQFTIGPYGRVTLHQARIAAQRIFAARLEGRDPAVEKREARRRTVADGVGDLLEAFIAQHVSQNRSAREISRLLRREIGSAWGNRSIHDIKKRDVIDVVSG